MILFVFPVIVQDIGINMVLNYKEKGTNHLIQKSLNFG